MIVYSISALNSRLSAVMGLIDGGVGNGVLRVMDVSAATLSAVPLAKPSGSVSGGVLTLFVPQAASISSSGVAAQARLEDSNGVTVASGLTVGTTSGFDIVTVDTTLTVGDTLSLGSATIVG